MRNATPKYFFGRRKKKGENAIFISEIEKNFTVLLS